MSTTSNSPVKKSARAATAKTSFSKEELAAMKERTRELKAAQAGADSEADVLAKIDEMPEPDRAMAHKIHTLIRLHAPLLAPRTWYGMPAYAKDGKVLCFFQSADKFKSRYATFGFSDKAMLDKGGLWPTAFALVRLGEEEEQSLIALLSKAIE